MSAFRRPALKDGSKVADWALVNGGKLGRDVWAVENSAGVAGVIKTARGIREPWPERFVYEVQVMGKLQHLPGVLQVVDRDPGSEPTWMVTERAVGLVDQLGAEPDFRTVVSAFADLAATLVEAAEFGEGIAHRDIKPPNLFYVRDRAVLGDFGLATGHLYKNLTMDGGKVGPANFAAPETLDWKPGTNPFPADVFSLAKSLWAVAASQTYPPQGPLLIRLSEVDLTKFGGEPTEHLARLLELATQTRPTSRPTMATIRDELRTWLDLYPPGSTPRPITRVSRVNIASVHDEFFSVRARELGGLGKVVDGAVHDLLDGCRDVWPGPTSLTDGGDAYLEPQLHLLSGGDPDWTPDSLITKKLIWNDLPSARLVATGVLVGEDDLRYYVSWQMRDPATLRWAVTWRDERRVQMRLPSDVAERRRLQVEIRNAMPSTPRPAARPTPELGGAIRGIAAAAGERERK